MRAHLVRHADAEPRRGWSEPDRARPLSAKGVVQAERLQLDAESAEVASSPAVRCTTTIEPWARRAQLEVNVDERLAEGADPRDVVEWICTSEHDLVLCGHGDLLPEVLRLLQLRGMTLDGPAAVAKGSIWSCTVEGGQPLHASYSPPPSA